MKLKFLRKLTGLLLCTALLSAAGCGESESQSSSAAQKAAATTEEATTVSTENAAAEMTALTALPTDATASPTEATVPPTEATVPPTEATVPPTEATVPPTEATVPPTEATVPPTEATVPPTEATVPPTEATVPPTEATTSVSPAEFTAELIRLVNETRAAYGVAPLTANTALSQAAQIRAAEIISVFDHIRPDGSECFTVLDGTGLSYWSCGENIAMGQRTPQAVLNAWMQSDGHRANILDSDFDSIGIGYEPSSNAWVQLFIGT